MWLFMKLSHSKRINKKKKCCRSNPSQLPPALPRPRHTHTPTHTHTLQRKGHLYPCSEGHASHPTLFQIGKYPELIMVFRHSTFFLHVQFKCTMVKTTCDVFTAESQCSSDASPPPPPLPFPNSEVFSAFKKLHSHTALE